MLKYKEKTYICVSDEFTRDNDKILKILQQQWEIGWKALQYFYEGLELKTLYKITQQGKKHIPDKEIHKTIQSVNWKEEFGCDYSYSDFLNIRNQYSAWSDVINVPFKWIGENKKHEQINLIKNETIEIYSEKITFNQGVCFLLNLDYLRVIRSGNKTGDFFNPLPCCSVKNKKIEIESYEYKVHDYFLDQKDSPYSTSPIYLYIKRPLHKSTKNPTI